jgi:hypothetical protein
MIMMKTVTIMTTGGKCLAGTRAADSITVITVNVRTWNVPDDGTGMKAVTMTGALVPEWDRTMDHHRAGDVIAVTKDMVARVATRTGDARTGATRAIVDHRVTAAVTWAGDARIGETRATEVRVIAVQVISADRVPDSGVMVDPEVMPVEIRAGVVRTGGTRVMADKATADKDMEVKISADRDTETRVTVDRVTVECMVHKDPVMDARITVSAEV